MIGKCQAIYDQYLVLIMKYMATVNVKNQFILDKKYGEILIYIFFYWMIFGINYEIKGNIDHEIQWVQFW